MKNCRVIHRLTRRIRVIAPALVKEGRPIEDIAADFGVSPLVVQRRL